ncbi:MAG: type II toxin-antitoxin system RelE/ParE family toxin [Dysgonamonadaceae bacterium]|jgi:plasmid stabilization system protein ParE|nr:type II toxin-antitoxin system RelE/ParE family toxin [Dysgonamonadaceae bacterium]
MKTYPILFSRKARNDIFHIYDYIAYELAMPNTAIKYFDGINDTIRKLAITGASYAVSRREYLKIQYGADVRTVTYKKMTIGYNIVDDTVYIRRVMPGSMVF